MDDFTFKARPPTHFIDYISLSIHAVSPCFVTYTSCLFFDLLRLMITRKRVLEFVELILIIVIAIPACATRSKPVCPLLIVL